MPQWANSLPAEVSTHEYMNMLLLQIIKKKWPEDGAGHHEYAEDGAGHHEYAEDGAGHDEYAEDGAGHHEHCFLYTFWLFCIFFF
jgi:hypothetical protein